MPEVSLLWVLITAAVDAVIYYWYWTRKYKDLVKENERLQLIISSVNNIPSNFT